MVSRAPFPPPPAPPFAFIPSVERLRVPELINSVRQVESGSRENRTSRKGALGPMQVMPETLKNPGYGMAPATDYSQSGLDRFGQEYLQRMIQHYGDVRDALVAYNWGPGNANKWIRRGRKEAALPRETRDYLNKVGLDYAQRVKDEPSPLVQTAAAPLPPPPAPPVQTAAAAAPAPAPAPDTPSPVPPPAAPAAPDEPAQDWMASAFYGPTLSRAEGREDRRADEALSLFQTAQRFLSPGPRTVAQRGSYADGGEVDLATIAAGGSGPDEEMRQGLGSLVDRARAMFPTPSDAPLFDDTGYERGTVLPFRRNIETGEMEFATPGLIAEPLNAMQRSVAAARSGQQVQPGDVAEALGLVGATSLALPRAVTQVPAGALGAMKPRGGNWLTKSVDDALDEIISNPKDISAAVAAPAPFSVEPRMVEISKWMHSNFKNYVLRDMATPEDPVRKAIDEGVKFGTVDDSYLGTIEQYTDITPSSKLKRLRAQAGFPEEGFATTPQGKTYEIFTDSPVMSFNKRQLLDPDFVDQAKIPEWVKKLNPGETVYKLNEYNTGVLDIAQPLLNALIRATDPQTDLPINLRVDPDSLKRMSVKDVVKLTSDIDDFRRAEADKAVMATAKETALVNKVDDFDLKFSKGKGGAWLELPNAETGIGLNVCTKLGAAGGWCTMKGRHAREYTESGKLYVLVDGDGRPHIQIYEKPLPEHLREDYPAGAKEIVEIKFPENDIGGDKSTSYIGKDPEYVSKTSKAVMDFLNSRNLGYVNRSDLEDLKINGKPVLDQGVGSKPRFVVKGDETPRPYAEGGAVRVPEGEPDETASGVGSLAGRARAMFEVEPLDYRPAARGARAAAERLGEELRAPGRVPAPDVRQQLERMARDALEAGKVAGEVGYELLVPQDLTDVALMALMGPGARVGGKVLRRGVGATLMALDPEEVIPEESAVKNYANGGEVHSGVGSLAPAARNMTRRTA